MARKTAFLRTIIPALVFLATALVYLSNGRPILPSADTVPAHYLPVSILTKHSFNLDTFTFLGPSSLVEKNSHRYSYYPVGTPLLATPVYAAARWAGMDFSYENLYKLEKLSATIIVSLSAVFVFLALNEIAPLFTSLLLTFIYAFGTCSWAVSSQALWQHGPTQLFNILAVYFLLLGKKNPKFIKYSGLSAGLNIFVRITNILFLPVFAAYVLHKHRKQLPGFLVLAVLPLIPLFYYNLQIFDNLMGGYSNVSGANAWNSPFFTTLFALLFSPSRGLFIFSPVLLFSFIGIYLVWKKKDNILLRYVSLLPVISILLLSKYVSWHGGGCFGPRLLADTLPAMALLMVPVIPLVKKSWFKSAVLLILILYSTGAQVLGAYFDDNSWNAYPNFKERLWDWKRPYLLFLLKGGKMSFNTSPADAGYYSVKNEIDFTKPESSKYLGYGWSITEPGWGTWSIIKESTILAHFEGNTGELSAVVSCASYEGQKMQVYLNGNILKEVVFTRGLGAVETFTIPLPSEYLNHGIETLKFKFSEAKKLSLEDTRNLSVAFKKIHFYSGDTILN